MYWTTLLPFFSDLPVNQIPAASKPFKKKKTQNTIARIKTMQQKRQHINKPGSLAQHKEQKREDLANHISETSGSSGKGMGFKLESHLIPSTKFQESAGGGRVGEGVTHHIEAMR